MSVKQRVGLDLDGVVYDWVSAANNALLEGQGIADLEPHTSWGHLDQQLVDRYGKKSAELLLKWLWSDGIYLMFSTANVPYAGAGDFMRELAAKYELVVITSRPRNAAALTYGWLALHKVNAAEVHVLGHNAKKSEICCDAYIEDRDVNVQDLIYNTPSHVYCPRRDWNSVAFTPDDAEVGFLYRHEENGHITRYDAYEEVLRGLEGPA